MLLSSLLLVHGCVLLPADALDDLPATSADSPTLDSGCDSPGTWAPDEDEDGHGDEDQAVFTCHPSDTMVADATDCDDGDSEIHPGAEEHCDDVDQDCDDLVDEDPVDGGTLYQDQDGDGYGSRSASARGTATTASTMTEMPAPTQTTRAARTRRTKTKRAEAGSQGPRHTPPAGTPATHASATTSRRKIHLLTPSIGPGQTPLEAGDPWHTSHG